MPGTKFYTTVREQLGEKQNWQDSGDLAMLFQGSFSTAFYRQLHSVVHKEFRARKAWQVLKCASSSPLSSRARGKSLLRLAYNLLTLPAARFQLNRLEAQSHHETTFPPHLAPETASRPMSQNE